MEKRIISITGTSFFYVKTDFVRIQFDVRVVRKIYEKALSELTEKVNSIIGIIINNGFNKNNLKTSNFDIQKETKYDSKKQESYFIGYRATENLSISFEIDNKKISSILNDIWKMISDVDFNVSFYCSNPNTYENQLIELAVKDAKEKAELITKAVGVKLLKITKIDYSFSEIHIENTFDYEFSPKEICCESSINMPEMDPEDTKLKKSINIEWEIE